MVASKSPNPAKRSSMEKNKSTPTTSSGKKGHGSSTVGDSPAANHRPPNTSDPILLSIASRQATLVQQQITLTCYIPSNSVGAVIGRKGATIAHIQKQAQQAGTSNGPVRLSIVGHQTDPSLLSASGGGGDPATTSTTEDAHSSSPPGGQTQLPQSPKPQIQTIPATPLTPSAASCSSVPYTYSELDWSSPNWTPVVIRADPCSALTAAQLLRDKVEYMDDVVMDVPLGRAKHAAIVGRRGFILANLSADTGVRIMVPRRELRHDVIQLEGDLDNVKQCLDRILGITSDSTTVKKGKGSAASTSNNNNNNASNETRQQPQDAKGNSTNNHDSSSSGTTQIVLNVPTLPSQTKLRTVGRKTDTIIKKKKAGGAWDVTISGSSQDNVQSAITMLKKWVDDKSASNNNDNSNNDDAGDTSNSNNNRNSNNAGTPARPKGRGRPQGRGNNKNKGSRGKGNTNNSSSNNNNNNNEASEPSSST